jgi:UDP-N-acetylmuramoyl-tripeptide--D-alanyl-D-alanine ligase
MSWTAGQLAAWCGGELHGPADVSVEGVSTDTRTLRAGDLFVAISGPSFDGHAFIEDALAAGARCLLLSREPEHKPGVPAILVGDTVTALGELARAQRRHFAGPVVAITGSNGKTTTKELTAAVLEAAGVRTRRTPGNLNNHIGLPLSILGLREADRALVVELGMNHPGEIDGLASIASPSVAAITNVAPAHLGPLGSIEAIARAKGEIFDRLRPDGTAVVNADDARVVEQARRFGGRRVRFGRAPGCEFRATGETSEDGLSRFELHTPAGAASVRFSVPGSHLVDDALCAVAAAWSTGLLGERALEAARAALEGFMGVPGRSGLITTRAGLRVLDDTYNANPHSLGAALRTLAALRGPGRLAAVLGDMLELGDQAEALHAACGRQAAAAGVELLVCLGPLSRHACAAARAAGVARAVAVDDPGGAARAVGAWARPGDVVLVKGSRGMRMEAVVSALAEGA